MKQATSVIVHKCVNEEEYREIGCCQESVNKEKIVSRRHEHLERSMRQQWMMKKMYIKFDELRITKGTRCCCHEINVKTKRPSAQVKGCLNSLASEYTCFQSIGPLLDVAHLTTSTHAWAYDKGLLCKIQVVFWGNNGPSWRVPVFGCVVVNFDEYIKKYRYLF